MIRLRPSPKDLETLKTPLGQLLTGEPEETMPKLSRLVKQAQPPTVTTVGDVVSLETMKAGVSVNLRIVDRRSMRKPTPKRSFPTKNIYRVENPPGGITLKAWNAIKRAMKNREAIILVEGEEDLLALPAIVESPNYAFVIYGQPSQGMVVVTTSPIMKEKVSSLLDQMSKEEVPG